MRDADFREILRVGTARTPRNEERLPAIAVISVPADADIRVGLTNIRLDTDCHDRQWITLPPRYDRWGWNKSSVSLAIRLSLCNRLLRPRRLLLLSRGRHAIVDTLRRKLLDCFRNCRRLCQQAFFNQCIIFGYHWLRQLWRRALF